MSVILPTVLARANSEGQEVYKETSARLLHLVSNDQGTFREVVGGMTADQRAFMESVILKGREAEMNGRRNVKGEEEGKEPSIALRMDFGV